MKNKTRIIFVMFMLTILYAFAQDTTGTGTGTSNDIAAYFLSPIGVVALITLLTGWITTHLISSDTVFLGIHIKQWIACLVSIAICFFGFWQQLGIFQHVSSATTILLQAIGYGLTANGTATLPAAQSMLRLLKAKEPK